MIGDMPVENPLDSLGPQDQPEYCVIDTAKGGKVLRVFKTREEAMKNQAKRSTPDDPKRYRVWTR